MKPYFWRIEWQFRASVSDARKHFPTSRYSLDQMDSFFAISSGTLCNKYSDRHTICIHGKVNFGIEPPFVRLMSWLPPFAPAAWGCTLQCLASIINHSKSGSSTKISSSFPKCLCPAICETVDKPYPVSRNTAADPATVLPFAKSRKLRWETGDYLLQSLPTDRVAPAGAVSTDSILCRSYRDVVVR